MYMNDVFQTLLPSLAEGFQQKSVLITGGTGYVGKCLLHLFAWMRVEHDCEFKVTVISRSPQTFQTLHPSLVKGVSLLHGEISSALTPPDSPDFIIHAATPASAELTARHPNEMTQINIDAMKWILKISESCTHMPTLLFTSSGAAYGLTAPGENYSPEEWFSPLGLPSTNVAYSEGKRIAEQLLLEAGARGIVRPTIARLFAFAGPYLPQDSHFAVGNFVRDAVNGSDIVVRGDGKSVRSYLNSFDLAFWLLRCLTHPQSEYPYNIGSEVAISIHELARLVLERANLRGLSGSKIQILGQVSALDGVDIYLPSTLKTRDSLDVSQWTTLEESIDQMILSSTT